MFHPSKESDWPQIRAIKIVLYLVASFFIVDQGFYYLDTPSQPYSYKLGSEYAFKLGQTIGMVPLAMLHFLIAALTIYFTYREAKIGLREHADRT